MAASIPAIYTVQEGDSLSLISKKLFGDFSQTNRLAEINKISNANLIYPGQQLVIPTDVGKSNVTDAHVVSSSSSNSSETKTFIGKYFPWLFVAAAVALLTYEANKQHKKNKAKKTLSGFKWTPALKKKAASNLLTEANRAESKTYKKLDNIKFHNNGSATWKGERGYGTYMREN